MSPYFSFFKIWIAKNLWFEACQLERKLFKLIFVISAPLFHQGRGLSHRAGHRELCTGRLRWKVKARLSLAGVNSHGLIARRLLQKSLLELLNSKLYTGIDLRRIDNDYRTRLGIFFILFICMYRHFFNIIFIAFIIIIILLTYFIFIDMLNGPVWIFFKKSSVIIDK